MADNNTSKQQNQKLTDQGLELDLFDLEGIEDPFGTDLLASDKSQNATQRFFTGLKRGLFDKTVARQTLRRAMVGSLPEGYQHLYQAVTTGREQLARDFETLKVENPQTLLSLVEKTEKVLPHIKTRVPARFYARLESRVKESREAMEAELDYQRRTSQTAEQVSEDTIAQTLLELQAVSDARQSQANDERELRSLAERSLKDQVERGRFNLMHQRLGQVSTDINRLVQYQDQVTYQFQRKSIELQYRSYFALRDMKQMMGARMLLEQQEFIRRNTQTDGTLSGSAQSALATHEAAMGLGGTPGGGFSYGSQIKRQLTNKAVNQASRFLPNYLAEYYPNLRRNLISQISGFLQNMDTMIGAGDMMGGMDKATMAGMGVGGAGADYLSSRISPFVARALRPVMDRLGDRAGGQHHMAAYYLNNLPALIQEYTQDLNQSHGWRGHIQNLVRGIAPTYYLDDEIKDGSYQTIDREARFNQLTQRSIVDIIPGYLSRILHETRMLRTGDHTLEREVYDITRGKFTGYQDAQRSLAARVVSEQQRRDISTTLDQVVEGFDQEGRLSPEAQKALRDRLLRDAATGGRFDPSRYASESNYADDTDPEVLAELSQFFQSRFGIGADGKMRSDAETRALLNQYSNHFLRLRDVVPDPRKEIRRLTSTGGQELLRDLGLLRTELGQDRISYDRLFGMYGGSSRGPDEEVGLSGLKPSEPPKPRSFKETLDAHVDAGLGRIFGGAPTPTVTEVNPEETPTEDLYVPGEDSPVITQREFRLGKYIDSLTGRVIRSYEDIKGAVRDRWGTIVLRQEDVEEGLTTKEGKPIKTGADRKVKTKTQSTDQIIRVKEAIQASIKERSVPGKSQWKDLFTKSRERALLARGIKDGRYIDVNTQRVIQSTDDITGEVKDLDGNTVLTDAEFSEGLIDAEGNEVRGGTRGQLMKSYFNVTSKPARMMFKIGARVAWGVGKYATGLFINQRDAYLEGEEEPVLVVRKLKAGEYFDDKGNVIEHMNDINSDVYDKEGNLVLQRSDFRKLRQLDGSKHALAKRLRGVRRLLGKTGRGVGKLAGMVGRGWWRFTKAYYRGLGKFVGKRMGRHINRVAGANVIPQEWLQTGTDHILARVSMSLDTMREMLGGWMSRDEEPRKGSWQDILKRREAEKEKKASESTQKDSGDGGFLKKLTASLGGLFTRGLGDEEEGDGDGDFTYVDVSGGGDDKDKDKKKKGKDPKGQNKKPNAKPKGKWGRVLQSVKDVGSRIAQSSVGQSVGRVWNSGAMKAVRTVGRWAMKPVGWAARGALMAGSALASIVSAPVAVGVAAAVGVGAAAYAGWKYFSRRSTIKGVFAKLRVVQYGYSPNGWSAASKIIALEDYLEKAVIRSADGPATLDPGRINSQEVFEIMGVDMGDEDEAMGLLTWFDKRFKPIFLAYHTAMARHTQAGKLIEIEEGLTPELAHRILEMVTFPYSGETPYAHTQSAFDYTDEVDTDIDDIKEREEDVRKEYPLDKKALEAKETDRPSTAGEAVAATVAKAAPAARKTSKSGTSARQEGVGGNLAAIGKTSVDMSSVVVASIATGHTFLKATGQELTDLTMIRLMGYGMPPGYSEHLKALMSLERAVFDSLTPAGSEIRLSPANPEHWAKEYGPSLGLKIEDSNSGDLAKFVAWFQNRFLKVASTYASGVWALNASLNLNSAERSLKPNQQVLVAEYLVDLRFPYQGAEGARIWGIPDVLWPIHELSVLEDTARYHLEALKGKVREQQPTSAGNAAQTPPPGTTTPARQQAARRWNVPAHQVMAYSADTRNLAIPYRAGGQVAARGNLYQGIKEGTGGIWTTIPKPNKNRSKEAAIPTLEAVAAMTGVDVGLLLTFCSIESNFDYQVRNKLSSATGWFQFIDSTWDEMIQKHGAKYGIEGDPMRTLRLDPRVNALMGAEFLKANFEYLQRELGRTPTDTDLYLAHFMGAGGAVKFLRQDVNASAAQVFQAAAKANPNIFFKPTGQSRTIGEVYALMDEKVARHRNGASVSLSQQSANDPDLGTVGMGDTGPLPLMDEQAQPRGPSVGQRAATTVAPGAQVATGVLPSVASAPNAAEAAIAEDVAIITQHQEAVRQRAEQADRRQQHFNEQQSAITKEVGQVLKRQLAVQESMRDYLKVIASNFVDLQKDGLKVQGLGTAGEDTSNSTSPKPTASQRGRSANNTPPPISMHR